METSELLRLRLLSQQQALNAAICSLGAVTGTTASGAATCTGPHAPQEKAGDKDTSRTDGLVAAPNFSTPSTPATVTPEGPTQKDDLKKALDDALKIVEDMKKKLDSSLPISSTSGLPADSASAAALWRAEAAEGQLADLQQQNAALKKEGQVADLQEHFNALLQVL